MRAGKMQASTGIKRDLLKMAKGGGRRAFREEGRRKGSK